MPAIDNLVQALPELIPFVLTVMLIVGILVGVDWLIRRRGAKAPSGEWNFRRHVIMVLLTIIGIVVMILVLPTEPHTRTQLLGLVGLALTAVIALSSTTFVSNAMAGILLRNTSRFKPGDFIRVGEFLGRVTERGLFHTEVQTADRDLTTLPNFFLVSNPLKIVRSSGTIISATVSLGYDVPHGDARRILTKAAEESGLSETFTNVESLGDFSVEYRVAGFLSDVKQMVSAPSKLRAFMIDALHGAEIEIVSPNFEVHRRQASDAVVTAEVHGRGRDRIGEGNAAAVMFDKADAAEAMEVLQAEHVSLEAEIADIKKAMGTAEGVGRQRLERDLAFRENRMASIADELEAAEKALETEE